MALSRRLRAVARVLFIPVALAAAPALAASDPDRLGDIARAQLEADGVIGIVIALPPGGRPIWTGTFGMADPTAGLAMTAGALFRVVSISKPVTAWGAMRLAESGRLDLNARIGAWHAGICPKARPGSSRECC